MKWIQEDRVADYSDELITIRSTADKSVLFTGVLNMAFTFNFSPDNLKEHNTVECSVMGFADMRFYPFHILGSAAEVCKGQYDRVYEDKLTEEMLEIFEFYYLHKTQKSVGLCVFLTGEELTRRYQRLPDLPSNDTFERAVKAMPIPCAMAGTMKRSSRR